jgi:secondary thiamine-phosphate synthase enzyme
MIKTERITVGSQGRGDVIDITDKVTEIIAKSKAKEGFVNVFCCGSTASVSTIEYEPNLVEDVKEALGKIAPYGKGYKHHETWGDDNGAAHVRATIMGPGITVPFSKGKLLLGTWQQVVVLDFDTKPREREVVVQVVGE